MVGWSLLAMIGLNLCINFSFVLIKAINDFTLVINLVYRYVARFMNKLKQRLDSKEINPTESNHKLDLNISTAIAD